MVARLVGGGGASSGSKLTTAPKMIAAPGKVSVAPAPAANKAAAYKVAPAAPRMISNTPSPSPSSRISYGGGGGGMGSAADAAPAVSDEDYLSGDSQYQLQLAALMKALSDEQADTTAQKTKYNTDYTDAVKQLGWLQDDPTTADVDEGAWNFQDQTTAAGRAFQNQQNDFAGRGLLQSSAYAQKNDDLTRSLNDQLGSTNKAKQSFLDDLARQQGTFASDNQNQIQQARIEALARRASGISLT